MTPRRNNWRDVPNCDTTEWQEAQAKGHLAATFPKRRVNLWNRQQ
jgi:hypothetical protein